MATRDFVPQADNEGGLGTSLKKWASGFMKLLTVDTINKVEITPPAVGSTITIADGKTLTVSGDTTLTGNTDPWMIDILPFSSSLTATNWVSFFEADGSNSSVYQGSRVSDGTQNAELSWPIVMSAGTWAISLTFIAYNQGGIFSCQIDGVEVGTVDSYNEAASYNVQGNIMDVSVTTSGKKIFKLKMTSKNPSSSSYRGAIAQVRLIRTA